ncbi:hypothetical protein BCR44DRAFT_1495530 [Catenaria anguillulae PL171]|uniref:ATP-dependent DNA helicase n=1 Tax=Catenaria anguillulae PL171 TaxID=765915 RepID=A0A1Y2I4U1_9FUNG|nr:hypothetical protein BCR44DRAFT_1495530 [Catenaria anguillulae PL171]
MLQVLPLQRSSHAAPGQNRRCWRAPPPPPHPPYDEPLNNDAEASLNAPVRPLSRPNVRLSTHPSVLSVAIRPATAAELSGHEINGQRIPGCPALARTSALLQPRQDLADASHGLVWFLGLPKTVEAWKRCVDDPVWHAKFDQYMDGLFAATLPRINRRLLCSNTPPPLVDTALLSVRKDNSSQVSIGFHMDDSRHHPPELRDRQAEEMDGTPSDDGGDGDGSEDELIIPPCKRHASALQQASASAADLSRSPPKPPKCKRHNAPLPIAFSSSDPSDDDAADASPAPASASPDIPDDLSSTAAPVVDEGNEDDADAREKRLQFATNMRLLLFVVSGVDNDVEIEEDVVLPLWAKAGSDESAYWRHGRLCQELKRLFAMLEALESGGPVDDWVGGNRTIGVASLRKYAASIGHAARFTRLGVTQKIQGEMETKFSIRRAQHKHATEQPNVVVATMSARVEYALKALWNCGFIADANARPPVDQRDAAFPTLAAMQHKIFVWFMAPVLAAYAGFASFAALKDGMNDKPILVVNVTGWIDASLGSQHEHQSQERRALPSVQGFVVPALANQWANVLGIIINEVSMMGATILARADKELHQFKQVADRPFGGIVMLICGNFGHLPPVQDTALIDTILGGKHTAPMARQDLELFRLLTTVIRLTENHRFINDCLWERIVREARIGK